MTQHDVTEDSPGSALFPEYSTLYDFVAREVEALTDVQLDFTSDNWALPTTGRGRNGAFDVSSAIWRT